MNIGLIGFGGVGKAFVKLLFEKKEKLSDVPIVKYIINSKGGLYNCNGIDIQGLSEYIDKGLDLSSHENWIYGISIEDIVRWNEVDYLIELTSTNIKTGEPGLTHIKTALSNGINVITGNKGPILLAYDELVKMADENNVQLKIGCTTGGALPSVSGGIVGCAGADIVSIKGILNGTTNYILSEMRENEVSYEEALASAKSQGIAELDPSLDVEGFDTAAKILILTNSIMKSDLSLNDIKIEGITKVDIKDVLSLKAENKKLKLIGEITNENSKCIAEVKLDVIDSRNPLFNVDYKNKGIIYKTDTLGEITIIGGASGTVNAAASIFRDLINITK